MHYTITLVLLCALFIACNKKKDNSSNSYIELEYSNINIIDSINNTPINKKLLFNKYHKPIKNTFYSIDYADNTLYKYEIGKSTFEKVLNLNIDLRIVEYYIEPNEAYISFVLDDYINELYILKVLNFKGEPLVEKIIPNHTDYVLGGNFPHILMNGKDFYAHSTAKLLKNATNYTEKYVQMHWNIDSDVIEILPIAYPDNYHGKFWGFHYNIGRIAINDSIHAFTFYFNDSIFLYNTNTQKTSAHFAGTREKYILPDIKIKDLEQYHKEVEMDIFHNASFYFQMSYLPNKAIYLRHFRNNNKDINQILYDKNFKYIGEIKNNFTSFFDTDKGLINFKLTDSIILVENYDFRPKLIPEIAEIKSIEYTSYREKYLKENFDAGVQQFLEKTKLIPNKEDSVIIYQSTHCASCVKNKALSFLQEKDNKNTSIIVFNEKDKEMLSNHIFLSPIALCEDNSLSKDGYYHHMPHMYFWKGNKVTSSPIVEEKIEENI